jgi:hypothetical protein
MEQNENLFDKLKKMAGNNEANINILQEQIDVKLQMAYFKLAKVIKKELDKEKDYLQEVEKLYDPEFSIDEKKKLICILASFDNVAYYRSLEKYKEMADEELKPWVILGLQESRMMLESSLLDEKQLFISTGLGGKGTNLRYFVVLINNKEENYNETQQNLIIQEFQYSINKHGGELEETVFDDKFAKITCLLPIEKPVQEILSKTTKECNSFGDFINENFLITNVKKMSTTEIQEFLNKQDSEDNDHFEVDDEGSNRE